MQGLKEAIHRTGYYPEVVADGVCAPCAGEDVVSFFVHHEPTFDRDEVRRHLTVVVLTPSRLILAHTDEHAGDDMIPEPYTSTSTEAISLSSVNSVVVTRMVTNPTGGPTPAAEAVLTIGWGGVARSTSSPPRAATPSATQTTATPAPWPPTTSRSGSPPPPTAPRRCPPCCPSRTPSPPGRRVLTAFVEPAYGSRSLADVLPAVSPALGVQLTPLRPDASPRSTCRPHRRTSCSWSTAWAPTSWRRYAHAAPYLSSLLTPERGRHRRCAVDDRDEPHLARHAPAARRARRRRLHLADAGLRTTAQRAVLGQGRRPDAVAAPPDRFQRSRPPGSR